MINKKAVETFLRRKLDNWLWMKKLTHADIDDEFKKHYKVKPYFKTESWLHQKICFHIGMCSPEFLFLLDMGTGKALPVDEPVLTPTGYKNIGSLAVGDYVLGSDGKRTKVIGVFPQGIKPVVTMKFSDGVEVNCCDEHLWAVQTPNHRKRKSGFEVKPTYELLDDLRGKENKKSPRGNRKWFIPMAAPVQFDVCGKNLPIHPYVLGVLLGDGSLNGSNCGICCHEDDVEVVYRMASYLPSGVSVTEYPQKENTRNFGIKGNHGQVRKVLKNLEVNTLSIFKKIPEQYLMSYVENRKELLAGLLDTDGWVEPTGSFGFCSASKDLAVGMQSLVHCLGGSATLSKKHVGEEVYWNIYGRVNFVPFKLKRKAVLFEKNNKLPAYRSIESIELIGEAECVCIAVEAEDGLFLVSGAVVTHNTKILLDIITQIQREKKLKRALITVNGQLTIGSWQTAIENHSNLEPIFIDSSDIEAKWEKLISPTGDIAVIDYAGLHLALSKKVKQGKKHVLIRDDVKTKQLKKIYNFFDADESHEVKNTGTLRYAILRALTKDMNYRFASTGTPMGRNPEDVFGQFFLVDRGDTFSDTLGMFRAAFFVEKPHYWKGTEFVFDKTKEHLFNQFMQHRSIRYTDDECSDLPKCKEIPLYLDFSSEQREHYLHAVEGLINAGGRLQETDNAYHRMRQIVSGYLHWKDEYGEHTVRFEQNPKLDMLRVLLEDSGNAKFVVSYEYTESGRMITEMLTEMKIGFEWVWGGNKEKIAAKNRFIADASKRVFVMNSDAGGTGTDGLQEVCRYLVYYESPTSPITRKQVRKRVHREGQLKRTFIYDLSIKGSIDKRIAEFIKDGNDLHAALVDGGSKVKQMLII